MASISLRTMALPIITLLAYASTASGYQLTYKGCFSSSQPLTDEGTAQYQTSSLCQTNCVGRNNAVLGLSQGSDCYCGDEIPAASSLVSDSFCSSPCNGFGADNCGGVNYWSVYLTGLTNDVAQVGDGSSSSSSSTSTTSATTQSQTQSATSSSTTPSVVTSVNAGNTNTVVVTISASATSTANSITNNSSSPNTAGIAAGVVVGLVAVAAILGGVWFFLRRRRQRQGEEEYKRSAQVSDFMRSNGERKAPNTAYSQMSDSRLDPEIGRRNSVGSMADEQDYSRRILRVANPDSH